MREPNWPRGKSDWGAADAEIWIPDFGMQFRRGKGPGRRNPEFLSLLAKHLPIQRSWVGEQTRNIVGPEGKDEEPGKVSRELFK